MPRWTTTNRQYMKLAFDLAQKGRGRVEPNPMVGCVVVKNRRIIGRGYHRKFGGPHAEPHALGAAGEAARGATVYVTLEPCCHIGKTPPCTEVLIAAKVKRVVAAMRDPNPQVSGKGLKKLRAAGIQVDLGLLGDEAKTLNAPFVTFHTRRRPYVILKWAQSIDGKIATRRGDSKWITSRHSRTEAHAIRARVDAIVVGVNTILTDDPDLTTRLARPRRVATRVILDTHLRTPLQARVVRTATEIPTIIATSQPCGDRSSRRTGGHKSLPAHTRKLRRLRNAGCQVVQLRSHKSGVDLAALLRELYAREMTNILVEGGGRVLGAFLRDGLADEARVFVAPSLIGGEGAPSPLRHLGPASLSDLPKLTVRDITPLGPDLCYNIEFSN